MRTNPFVDTWQFLLGLTRVSLGEGFSNYVFLVLFAVLLAAAFGLALINWSADPSQKNGANIVTCICRVLIGCMWFHSAVSKLPLPISDAFKDTIDHMAQYAAFDVHRQLVAQFYLPHLSVIGPLVFLTEMSFAVSLILGFAVPLFAPLAALFSLHLWLGLYLDPGEWPWTFVFAAVVHTLFVTAPAGRILGLDALLHRHDVTGFKRAFG